MLAVRSAHTQGQLNSALSNLVTIGTHGFHFKSFVTCESSLFNVFKSKLAKNNGYLEIHPEKYYAVITKNIHGIL